MGDVDGGRIDAEMELAELADHQVAELGVEGAERLVHQEGLRPPDDGAAERDALAVATGEPRDRLVEEVLDAEEPRCLLDALFDLRRRHPLALEREADVPLDVHVRIEREELEDEGDVALRRRG